jgi:hypothetical protein
VIVINQAASLRDIKLNNWRTSVSIFKPVIIHSVEDLPWIIHRYSAIRGISCYIARRFVVEIGPNRSYTLFQEVKFNSVLKFKSGLQCSLFLCTTLNHIFCYLVSRSSSSINDKVGRAIAQAVSRWLPTAAARVRARVWSCEICSRQSGTGAGFLRVLRFPLPIFIPPIAPQSPSSITRGLYNRPEVAAVPTGLSPTPLRKKK